MPDQPRVAAPPRDPQWDHPWAASLGIFVLVACWVAVAAHWHTALHHDMAEQFVWAHAWQLGYPKHPPLPTWLFMTAQLLLPPVPATLYGLSAVCIGLTGVFTYLAARELLAPNMALCVALLWGLMQPFGWRAWIYNHNTVLVMTMAMAVYGAARAVRRGEKASWVGAGVAAGLAMSTKLQAAVPLLGLLWALWRSGGLDTLAARKGLAMACVLAIAVSLAPLAWMLTGHTNAMAYAAHQLGSGEMEGESVKLGQFVVSELRMQAAALVVLLVWVCRRYRKQPGTPIFLSGDGVTLKPRGWIEGLVLFPLAAVLAMGLLGGSKMHAQWGVQTFQFMPLALVMWFGHLFSRQPRRQLIATAAAVQGVLLLAALSPWASRLHAAGPVQGYPAHELVERILADWRRQGGGCPLRYVDGPFFEAGLMSAFSGTFPAVLQDGSPQASPWIDLADMREKGSVVIRYAPQDLPSDVVHTGQMGFSPPADVKGVTPIAWGIRPPSVQCGGGRP